MDFVSFSHRFNGLWLSNVIVGTSEFQNFKFWKVGSTSWILSLPSLPYFV